MNTLDDANLMRRFVEGDPEAFDVLHQRHCGLLCGRLRRAGVDYADAADIVQDAFVRAFRAARQYDAERGSFSAWIGRITHNCLARHFTRSARAQNVDAALLAEMTAGSDDPPDESAASAEEIAAVEDCVARLPGELRHIVELRFAGGRTTRAIAATVAASEATIRNRLTEAKGLLTRCLGGKGVM